MPVSLNRKARYLLMLLVTLRLIIVQKDLPKGFIYKNNMLLRQNCYMKQRITRERIERKMAKISKSMSFKNAVINLEENTITEITKDYTKTYELRDVLETWNGIEGISISIKQEDELPSTE